MLIQYDYAIVDMIIEEQSITEQSMLIKEWPMIIEEQSMLIKGSVQPDLRRVKNILNR